MALMRKLIPGLSILTILFPLVIHADVDVRRVNDRILLIGKSCADLAEEIAAIVQLEKTKKKAGNPPCKEPSRKTRYAQIDITALLPGWLRKYEEEPLACDGPNCWNTALKYVGLNEELRYCSPKEFTACLESPACKPIGTDQKLEPGDVLAIRTPDGEGSYREIHGMIYVTDRLVLSKNGWTKEDILGHSVTVDIQPAESVLYDYFEGSYPECYPRNGRIPGRTRSCDRFWIDAYRCQRDPENFQISNQQPEKVRAIKNTLTGMECTLGQMVFQGHTAPMDTADLRLFDQGLSLIQKDLAKEQKDNQTKEKPSSSLSWELKLLYYKTHSLREHIRP